MSEFFLELFSEEIPAGLQKSLRKKILDDFKNLFDERLIKFKKNFSLSSPNRLVVIFEGLDKQIKIKTEGCFFNVILKCMAGMQKITLKIRKILNIGNCY